MQINFACRYNFQEMPKAGNEIEFFFQKMVQPVRSFVTLIGYPNKVTKLESGVQLYLWKFLTCSSCRKVSISYSISFVITERKIKFELK